MHHTIKTAAMALMLCATQQTNAQPRYDYTKIQREDLNRGLVAIPQANDSVCLSWRFLEEDGESTAFNIYKNGNKLNKKPLKGATFVKVANKQNEPARFEVRTVENGKETHRKDGAYTLLANQKEYISIPLTPPAPSVTPTGRQYAYTANDASVGDVDGDGEYEIILKWDPTNSHDNSQEGYTGNVFIDCYKLNGTRLWRIDLGRNIRAGAHYTQFMVFDFDGDGRSELAVKTADGTIDGQGKCIGDADADYRFAGVINKNISKGKSVQQNSARIEGRILSGPEYLTVFSGATGAALATVDYTPGRGEVAAWGDNYGNRCDRFLAAVAYLDGVHPSIVECRGYYTRTVLSAWDWDGKQLKQRWIFDTDQPGLSTYAGQGNHNLRIADVDGDGCDEISYGSMAVDHDGKGLYTTGMGHGDALHLMAFTPDSDELQLWDVHENKRDGSDLRNAKTGEVIFQLKSPQDVGRGMAADIDPTNYGLEMWSSESGGIYNVKGEKLTDKARIPINFAVWWDGDLLREMLDRAVISKYDWKTNSCNTILDLSNECAFNNGTKSNPCVSADLFGDWREEVVVRTKDNSELRIYSTTIPTDYRFHTFMQEIPYRISVATQNVAYNQPPEPAFYFGSDFKKGTRFRGWKF